VYGINPRAVRPFERASYSFFRRGEPGRFSSNQPDFKVCPERGPMKTVGETLRWENDE
jgi:hypothetical protein